MEYTIGTKVFGDWEITREIGEGSYGKVFELTKSKFGITSKSAMKLIRIPKSTSEIREALSEGMDEQTMTSYFRDIVERFIREVAIMSEVKGHPHIVACEDYAVQEHEGSVGWDILVRMELLTSFSKYLLENQMTEEKAKQLGIEICEALDFCQQKGLIHRDIKPGNIFVDSWGRFKLGDFGVARTLEAATSGMSKQGTEHYMAPEVFYMRPYGSNVDVYSLGIVLYRLMNENRLPFWPDAPAPVTFTDKINALTKRMQGEKLPRPLNGSDEFVKVILKACEADPKERYRTAGEMMAALQNEKKESAVPPAFLDEEMTINPFDTKQNEEMTINPFDIKQNEEQKIVEEKKIDIETESLHVTADTELENEEKVAEYLRKHLYKLRDIKHTYFMPDVPAAVRLNASINWRSSPLRKQEMFGVVDLATRGANGVYVSKNAMLLFESGQWNQLFINFCMIKSAWVEGEKEEVLFIRGTDDQTYQYKHPFMAGLLGMKAVPLKVLAEMLNDIAEIYNPKTRK